MEKAHLSGSTTGYPIALLDDAQAALEILPRAEFDFSLVSEEGWNLIKFMDNLSALAHLSLQKDGFPESNKLLEAVYN